MFRIATIFALICSFLQVAPFANAATDEQQNPAQPVNAVIEWNRTLLTMVRTPGAQPASIHSTRNFAILHAAIYDAVNNIEPRFSPYLVRLPDVRRSASKIAAADQAAHDVLVFLYPAFQVSLDTELQQDLALLPDNERKTQGIAVGQAVAGQLLAARSADGANVTPPPYIPGTQPGDYQLTPPNFAPADFTQWPQVTPFALEQANEFVPVLLRHSQAPFILRPSMKLKVSGSLTAQREPRNKLRSASSGTATSRTSGTRSHRLPRCSVISISSIARVSLRC